MSGENEKLERLERTLSAEYSDAELEAVKNLTQALWEIVVDTTLPISDVISYVEEFEEEWEVDISSSSYILDEIIDLLEENKANADRLAYLLSEMDCLNAYQTLVNYDEKLLDSNARKQIKISGTAFDPDFVDVFSEEEEV